MPRQTIDRDTTWELDGNRRTWILTADATIETEGESAIYDEGSGSRIRILGSASSDTALCLQMGDGAPSLFIGKEGSVTSRDSTAVFLQWGGRIENHGIVAAGEYGISKDGEIVAGAIAIDYRLGGEHSLVNKGREFRWLRCGAGQSLQASQDVGIALNQWRPDLHPVAMPPACHRPILPHRNIQVKLARAPLLKLRA